MFAGAAFINSIICCFAAAAHHWRLLQIRDCTAPSTCGSTVDLPWSASRGPITQQQTLRPEGRHSEHRERPCASEGVSVRRWSLTDGETGSYRTVPHRGEQNDVASIVVSSSCRHSPRPACDRRCGHCGHCGPRGRTAAVMCELLGGPDIAVSRQRAECAGEAACAGERSGSPGAAARLRGVDRSLRHLPARRRKDHMLQYRNRLPGPGGGVPAQRALAGEEARELTGLLAFLTGAGSQNGSLVFAR
jgi:hypothetical protein